jgi:hypothetical protein
MKTVTSQDLYEANMKILKWTVRCEEALTPKQARRALKKIAKFSNRLARLQGQHYAQENNGDLL